MLIRVRSNVGLWRIDGLDENTATLDDLIAGIKKDRPQVVFEKDLSVDPMCNMPLQGGSVTLSSQKLGHGSMVHCRVDASTCSTVSISESSSNTKKVIGKDGEIKLVQVDSAADGGKGFRKGMLPLRDMKMHWRLDEFMELDNQFNFKIQRQEESWISKQGGLSIETSVAGDFQSYLSQFSFKRKRFGFLYGTFTKDEEDESKTKVKVECIYEPPQEADPESPDGFQILDDPNEERVDNLAELLGLTKVGWIFGHPPRSKDIVLSSAEIIMAAEFQLEAADGVKPTPFVTVKVTVDEKTRATSFEAFQVSLQCMEMVAEEALEIDPSGGDMDNKCLVNETYTALVEAKEAKHVPNDFFMTLVPIVQHQSDIFTHQFPKSNREGEYQSQNALKKQLKKSGTQGWNFIDLLSDFHLLLFLCNFMDEKEDMKKICECVTNREVPLPDGYKIIIASQAGIDGSY